LLHTIIFFIGIKGGGWGLEPPFVANVDIIFSYIYKNTTKLVLHLSYFVYLDCFSSAFNWWFIALN